MIEMPNRKEFTEIYLGDYSRKEIIEMYFISYPTLDSWAKRYGLTRKPISPAKECLELLSKENLSKTEFTKRAGCSGPTLLKYLKLYGIEVNFRECVAIDIDELYRLRVENQWKFNELAEYFKCSYSAIYTRCKEFEFPKVKVERLCEWKIASNKTSTRAILR